MKLLLEQGPPAQPDDEAAHVQVVAQRGVKGGVVGERAQTLGRLQVAVGQAGKLRSSR